MPVRPAGDLAVVGDPCLQSSRSKGTADVDIETRVDLQDAKPADLRLTFPIRIENQGICAGLWVHDIKIKRLILNQALYPFFC